MGSIVAPLAPYSAKGPVAPYPETEAQMMPGRLALRVSRSMPQLAITCGLKLSATMSNLGSNSQKISNPRGCFKSSVSERLFRLTVL